MLCFTPFAYGTSEKPKRKSEEREKKKDAPAAEPVQSPPAGAGLHGTAAHHIWQGSAQLGEPGPRLGESGAHAAPLGASPPRRRAHTGQLHPNTLRMGFSAPRL